MNIEELKQILKEKNINTEHYFVGFSCSIIDQGLGIYFEDGQWLVYHQDCGRRSYKKKTTDESEACKHFLRRVLKQEGTHLQL